MAKEEQREASSGLRIGQHKGRAVHILEGRKRICKRNVAVYGFKAFWANQATMWTGETSPSCNSSAKFWRAAGVWWARDDQRDDLRIYLFIYFFYVDRRFHSTDDIWPEWLQSFSVSSCFGSSFRRWRSTKAFHHSFIFPQVKYVCPAFPLRCPPGRRARVTFQKPNPPNP